MSSIPIYLRSVTDDPDLDSLLHPASAFDHPRDVVNDPDLTTEEKRAILSSWASDACAVESQPHLRMPPGGARAISFDDVVDALRSLDTSRAARWKRALRRKRSEDSNPDGGISLF
jgi:hypothetical protein